MEEHSEDARAVEEEARTTVKQLLRRKAVLTSQQVKIAVYASLFSNLGLCVLQREFKALQKRFH